VVNKLKTYMHKALKGYGREELIDMLAILLADSFAREYSYIHNGAKNDRDLYLGMHVYLCGKNAKNAEYSKILSRYINFITDALKEEKEKHSVSKENLN